MVLPCSCKKKREEDWKTLEKQDTHHHVLYTRAGSGSRAVIPTRSGWGVASGNENDFDRDLQTATLNADTLYPTTDPGLVFFAVFCAAILRYIRNRCCHWLLWVHGHIPIRRLYVIIRLPTIVHLILLQEDILITLNP